MILNIKMVKLAKIVVLNIEMVDVVVLNIKTSGLNVHNRLTRLSDRTAQLCSYLPFTQILSAMFKTLKYQNPRHIQNY